MTKDFRYAGPDGDRMKDLPKEAGAVLGSEYCVHLLPGTEALATAISASERRGRSLLLLTPYFRDSELKRSMPLFRSIPRDADVHVAVNDWGALFALHGLFPWLRLSIGRLLSGQKRCPRIGVSPRLTGEGRRWHGESIFSSARVRNRLRERFGVSGFHVDSTPWGTDLPECGREGGEGGTAPVFFEHGPYAIVTVSDACPWIGGRSSAAVASCPRPCRKGVVLLKEPSMGGEMTQRGKARFAAFPASPEVARGSADCRRFVRYDDLP